MLATWVPTFIIGITILLALSIADFVVTLFELPFDTWELVKEKFDQIE